MVEAKALSEFLYLVQSTCNCPCCDLLYFLILLDPVSRLLKVCRYKKWTEVKRLIEEGE